MRRYHWLSRAASEDRTAIGLVGATAGCLSLYFDANADGHDPANLQPAKALATQVQDCIACGILYQREDVPHFFDRLIPRQGLETTCVEEVRRYDVSEYWKELV